MLLLIHVTFGGAKGLGGCGGVSYRTHGFLLPSLMSDDDFITIIASCFFLLHVVALLISTVKYLLLLIMLASYLFLFLVRTYILYLLTFTILVIC